MRNERNGEMIQPWIPVREVCLGGEADLVLVTRRMLCPLRLQARSEGRETKNSSNSQREGRGCFCLKTETKGREAGRDESAPGFFYTWLREKFFIFSLWTSCFDNESFTNRNNDMKILPLPSSSRLLLPKDKRTPLESLFLLSLFFSLQLTYTSQT